MKRKSPLLLTALIAAALSIPPAALGQQEEDDGPGLGVARVSLINGDVTVRRGDSGDWIQAEVNMPLVEGDSIAAGRASRAEVQLDYSNLLRLNEESELNVTQLANRSFRVQVERGIVTYSELQGGEADMDIETPLVAVRPRKKGTYRIQVFGQDRVEVTVRDGEAHIASTEGIETLKEGRTMVIRGTGDNVEFQAVNADPKDDWDRWNERRDDQLRKSESYKYVNRSISGAQDLDGHGDWTYVSGYGRCWFPTATAGWAPYRDGRWIWIDYYGWSWVGYEPWGWAPYHYGRWFHHASYGWGWYPGSYYSPYYWRPALVGFFGFGSHGGFNIGIGFGRGYGGNIGWVPLAPGERFHPWYGPRYRNGYGRGGNTTIVVDNSVNIVNNYRNARTRDGVTVVDGNDFGRGGNLANRRRNLGEGELQRASVMRGQVPIVPDRENQGRVVRAASSEPQSAQRGGSRNTRFFSTSSTAPPASRPSFEQQREQLTSSIRSFGEGRGAGGAASVGESAIGTRSGRSTFSGRTSSPSPASAAAEPNVAAGVGERGGRSGIRSGSATGSSDAAQPENSSGRPEVDASRSRTGRGGFPRASAEPGASPESGASSPAAASEPSSRGNTEWRSFGRRGTPASPNQGRSDSSTGSSQRSSGRSRGSANVDSGGSSGSSGDAGSQSRAGRGSRFSPESSRIESGPATRSDDARASRSRSADVEAQPRGQSDSGSGRSSRQFGGSGSEGSRTFSSPRQASPPREAPAPRVAPESPSRAPQDDRGSRGTRQRFAPSASSRIQSGSEATRSVAAIAPSNSRSFQRESSSRTFSPSASSRAGIFGESRGSDARSAPSATFGAGRGGFETSRSSRVQSAPDYRGPSVSRAPAISQPAPSSSRGGIFGSSSRGMPSGDSGGFSRGGGSRGGGSFSRGGSSNGGGGSVSRGGGAAPSSSGGGGGGGGRSFGGSRGGRR